ncbi:MAG: hypothetical protein V1672_01260 [Candidatus Diapherotrites archaeon]
MKTIHIGLIAVFVILLVAGAYIMGGSSTAFISLAGDGTENSAELTEESDADIPTNIESIYNEGQFEQLSGFEEFSRSMSREAFIEGSRRPNREEYGIWPEVFEDLPPIPDDFGVMVFLFEAGLWKDLDYFGPEYYLQPEFFRARRNFDDVCNNMWRRTTPAHIYHGWGAYPARMEVNTYRGAEFKVKTFWYVPCGVENYQGFRLNYFYPGSSIDEAEEVYNIQNPGVVKDYFDVRIIDPEFLMGPTFPKYSVNPPFARVQEVEIKVHENAVPGEYVIAIDTGGVSDEQHDAWLEEYKIKYNDAAGAPLVINIPHWSMHIIVN